MIFWDQFKDKLDEEENEEQAEAESSSTPTPPPPLPPEEKKEKVAAVATEKQGLNSRTKVAAQVPSSEEIAANDQKLVANLRQDDTSEDEESPGGRFSKVRSFFKGKGGGASGGRDREETGYTSWSEDTFESVVTQRNMLFLFTIVCVVTIAISVLLIRYVKNTQTIEPFVIEIEEKSGVPTVVTPVDISVYSADEAVKRYFIMKYIRAREEYFPSTFQDNFFNVVRVLSTSAVYFNDYRPKFAISNPNSPYNIFGESSSRRVILKSLIFQSPNTAQVRIAFEVNGIIKLQQNKIVLMDFNFANIEMNEDERFTNPLGFQVTFYRIEDESS